eukprot:2193179-Rhodomonas_salina.1
MCTLSKLSVCCPLGGFRGIAVTRGPFYGFTESLGHWKLWHKISIKASTVWTTKERYQAHRARTAL